MDALVLASQVQQGQIMHESLSRLKYDPPYFVKALFTLAMQAQAHKCVPLYGGWDLRLCLCCN